MTANEHILNSAIELFSAKGFDGVSIRQIADHAQVHFSSIRYHFGDKEDLYKACISLHGNSRLDTALKYLVAEPKTIDEIKLRLSFALDETFQIHSENPSLSKLVLHEIESSSGKLDQVLKKTMVAMTEVYINFFKNCQKNKLISGDLDPIFLTQSLMGILHHYMRTENIRARIMSHSSLKNKEFREKTVNNIIHLFIN